MKSDKRLYDKSFYTNSVLEKAIEDYSEIADISISDKRTDWECSFESKGLPIDVIISEFDNYLIELLNGSNI